MKVYKWIESKQYACYMTTNLKDEKKMLWKVDDEPAPSRKQWNPITLEQYLGYSLFDEELNLKTIGDNPHCPYGLQLISHKAKEALTDIWEEYTNLYPVILKDTSEPFYIVVPKLHIDCLDKKKSEIMYSKHDNTPSLLINWSIINAKLEDAPIFSIDFGKIIETDFDSYFITDNFKNRVIDADLEGFCFIESMSEAKPFIS